MNRSLKVDNKLTTIGKKSVIQYFYFSSLLSDRRTKTDLSHQSAIVK